MRHDVSHNTVTKHMTWKKLNIDKTYSKYISTILCKTDIDISSTVSSFFHIIGITIHQKQSKPHPRSVQQSSLVKARI